MAKREVRLCPACGSFYKGPHAVSRKNPKVAICQECGTKEAIEAAKSFNSIFGPTMAVFAEARREVARCSASS